MGFSGEKKNKTGKDLPKNSQQHVADVDTGTTLSNKQTKEDN